MTPAPLLSVVNQSTRLTDSDVAKMVEAISIQLARDVAPIHGQTPAMEVVPAGGKPNGAPVYLQDQPDVPDALGYHDEDGDGSVTGTPGTQYIKVFVAPTLDNGGTALSGPNSVSVTLSHEVCELVGDGPANKWADSADGSDYAYELCDAVEGDSYDVTIGDGSTVAVSNFVYPAFFDPKAQAGSKLDYLGKVSVPFGMTPGGYEIHRTEPGQTTQVFAARHGAVEVEAGVTVKFGSSFPEWKKAGKLARAKARRGSRARAA